MKHMLPDKTNMLICFVARKTEKEKALQSNSDARGGGGAGNRTQKKASIGFLFKNNKSYTN